MKPAALIAAVLVLASAVYANEQTVNALKKCATDSGITRESLQAACEGTLPADLEKYKCYTQCVQQLVGMMSANGTVDPQKAAAALVGTEEQQIMYDIAVKCPGDNTSNLCDKAFSVDQCYIKQNKDMYKRNCNTLMATVA